MAKQDFPPLIPSGIHSLSLSEFETLTTTSFSEDVRRAELYSSFTKWLTSLKALGVVGKIWVDGSFLTSKQSPSDIDCVAFNLQLTRQISNTEQLQLKKLLSHNEAKAIYNLDFYIEITDAQTDFHRRAYWSGVFGYQHDRVTAKGFVELAI